MIVSLNSPVNDTAPDLFSLVGSLCLLSNARCVDTRESGVRDYPQMEFKITKKRDLHRFILKPSPSPSSGATLQF